MHRGHVVQVCTSGGVGEHVEQDDAVDEAWASAVRDVGLVPEDAVPVEVLKRRVN